MNLSERKLFEISQKLESLAKEFKHWRDKSKATKPLQKNHTQIRRITFQLEGMQAAISDKVKTLQEGKEGEEGDILSQARELELDILEVHRIWEFFRSKLVLRSIDWFNPYLVAADEFAWACYEVAQKNLKEGHITKNERKEPPLVFFNGGSSPYTLPRNLTYEAENVPGEQIRNISATAVLKELPIPVIGIPWYQVQHLPDSLVIGHEVGHDVEEDFQLTDRIGLLLEEGMKNIPKKNQPAWRSWLRETFADLYGNLAGGPAYVQSLLDFLANDKKATQTDQRDDRNWGQYPPDYLRILINLEALSQQGFVDDSKKLGAELLATYGTHAMQDFVDDIHPIVKALFDGPYPEFDGKSLKQVILFTPADQKKARSDCGLMLGGSDPTTDSIRVLLASAQLAFREDSTKYAAKNVHDRVLNRVPVIQRTGVRAEARKKLKSVEQDEFDKAAGMLLFKKLRTAEPKSEVREG